MFYLVEFFDSAAHSHVVAPHTHDTHTATPNIYGIFNFTAMQLIVLVVYIEYIIDTQ